ncbi:hypothetical protein NWFMUON74_58080 [Nocardia wallacei]|uniref:Uncharacterized protein n=1 Tax=Nocardia wallacei TaxID=480035 RepID=A0A7G1KTX3_9NOCA|nr:hypothetical protein NWFMUON74_58080 [Nocardia wallacei]
MKAAGARIEPSTSPVRTDGATSRVVSTHHCWAVTGAGRLALCHKVIAHYHLSPSGR